MSVYVWGITNVGDKVCNCPPDLTGSGKPSAYVIGGKSRSFAQP